MYLYKKKAAEAKEWIPDSWKCFSGVIVSNRINKQVVGKCNPEEDLDVNQYKFSKDAEC